MTDPAPKDLRESVAFLTESVLRHEQALIAIAEDERLPEATRTRVAAALAGEPS